MSVEVTPAERGSIAQVITVEAVVFPLEQATVAPKITSTVKKFLVQRGARTTLWQAAALGLMDRVDGYFTAVPPPTPDEITNAFWCACHGGQRTASEYLLGRGADLNWIGYDGLTPLDAATRSGASELVEWLRSRSARSARASTVG